MLGTEEILENIVRLVSLLNNGILHEVDELPYFRAGQMGHFSSA